MTKFVAFLRGINVGGHRKIPMTDLRRICVAITSDPTVRTYIASGNVMFAANSDADALAKEIAKAVKGTFGFDVPVLVLNEVTLRATLDGCPFPRDAGKCVHAFLCYDDLQLDSCGVAALKSPTEAVAVVGRTVWLYAPDGIGRSKLAVKMEKLIGVAATARNLNTMIKMVEMLEA